jgi:hypothetical protein
MDTIVLDEMRHCAGIGNIVYGCHLYRRMVYQKPEKVSAYAAKTINGNFCFCIHFKKLSTVN